MEMAGINHRIEPRKRPNRVFIVDDDADVRELLCALLETHGFRVDTFDSAGRFLSSGGSALIGCLLTDVQMPGMSGIELQTELNRRGAHLAIIVMAGSGVVTVAVGAMKAGAIDFLEKPFSGAALLNSVRRALDFIWSAETSFSLAEIARERIALLTKREREVLARLVVCGSNKAVARQLGISPRTVEVHRAHAIRKMGVKNLTELVRMPMAGMDSHALA